VHRLIDDHGTIFGLNLHSKFAAFPDEDLNTSLLAEEVRGQAVSHADRVGSASCDGVGSGWSLLKDKASGSHVSAASRTPTRRMAGGVCSTARVSHFFPNDIFVYVFSLYKNYYIVILVKLIL